MRTCIVIFVALGLFAVVPDDTARASPVPVTPGKRAEPTATYKARFGKSRLATRERTVRYFAPVQGQEGVFEAMVSWTRLRGAADVVVPARKDGVDISFALRFDPMGEPGTGALSATIPVGVDFEPSGFVFKDAIQDAGIGRDDVFYRNHRPATHDKPGRIEAVVPSLPMSLDELNIHRDRPGTWRTDLYQVPAKPFSRRLIVAVPPDATVSKASLEGAIASVAAVNYHPGSLREVSHFASE